MTKSTRIGGVTVQFNEDGTLFIYQPDSSRVMSGEMGLELIEWLCEHGPKDPDADPEADEETEAACRRALSSPILESTVPAGVINTSEGAVESTVLFDSEAGGWQPGAQEVIDSALASDGITNLPENPSLKDLRACAEAFGVSPAGSKAQIVERLKKRGITGPGLDD